MKITRLFLFALLGSFLLNSCSSDDDNITPDPVVEGKYSDGFFVLNEGGTGTVSYISNDLQTVENEIFAAVNGGDDLGQFAQSMFFSDDRAFIISNGSNLITVVDRYTFELIGKIESGFEAPRYGTAVNGKAYVTNQAAWDSNQDDYIAVIDLETLKVEENIVIGDYVESIIEENGLLYIENAAFGTGNKISVFDPATKSIQGTIDVKDGLNSFEIENNRLYALSSDGLTVIDLSSNATVSEITFSDDLTGARNLEVEGDDIYYTINNAVYTIGIDATAPAEEALIEYTSNSQYGKMYGFEVENGRIYIADGGDFQSNSFVEIYSVNGDVLEKINVGVGPNGFYFNN